MKCYSIPISILSFSFALAGCANTALPKQASSQTTPVKAEARTDIRSPLASPLILRDFTEETEFPSPELDQFIGLAVQLPMNFQVIVAKGSPLAAEVEKQVKEKGLIERVQLIER